MGRKTLALTCTAALAAGVVTTACLSGPPPTTYARCARHPVTHHLFGTDPMPACAPYPYVVANVPCGPLTWDPNDGECLRVYRPKDPITGLARFLIIPRSAMRPGDVAFGAVV